MADNPSPALCSINACRLLTGHHGKHDAMPKAAWAFFADKDQDKIDKAGYATPRGGSKGAYQNHVVRSNRVIIPYERLKDIDLACYHSYIVRLFADQFFAAPATPKPEFQGDAPQLVIGRNAFVLYRTHESFKQYPPLPGWEFRGLVKNGKPKKKRGPGVEDSGHYVLRLPRLGALASVDEGVAQGLFAPEYADPNTNFLCRCVLAWLIIHTVGSPYTTQQAANLRL